MIAVRARQPTQRRFSPQKVANGLRVVVGDRLRSPRARTARARAAGGGRCPGARARSPARRAASSRAPQQRRGATPRPRASGTTYMRLISASPVVQPLDPAAGDRAPAVIADEERAVRRGHLRRRRGRRRAAARARRTARSSVGDHRGEQLAAGGASARSRRKSIMPLSSRTAMARDWSDLFITDGAVAAPGAGDAATEADEPEQRRGFFRACARTSPRRARRWAPRSRRRCSRATLDEETWERLEEALIMADVGARPPRSVVGQLEQEATAGDVEGGEALERAAGRAARRHRPDRRGHDRPAPRRRP